jgi:hypothetical protein
MAEDEAERFLDLAGFADRLLDPDEQERVAERLARNPAAKADVAAARVLAERGLPGEALSPQVIARACALVGERSARGASIIPFPQRFRPQPSLPGVARWASLAAALVVASWFGFDLGSTTFAALVPTVQAPEDGLVRDMLDPSTGFVRDLTEGVRA